jgi:hypothetical protein
MVAPIRHRHLKQLVHAATGLRGPKLDTTLWRRLEPWSVGLPQKSEAGPGAAPDELPAPMRLEMSRLRALVAAALHALADRTERHLPRNLAGARQAWDKVDHHDIVEPTLEATLDGTRRTLQLTASRDDAAGGIALQGLLALEAARGLVALAERRLSSLIRLRIQDSDDLLPGGRPFLDIAPALAEAARAWE